MKIFKYHISKAGSVLFLLHICFVMYVYVQDYEGSWGGFLLFIIDLPVSLIAFIPIGLNQWLFFGVVGSFWWYIIGCLIEKFIFSSRR